MRLLPLIAATYFMVSGGAYGLEDILGMAGYGRALVLLLVVPVRPTLPTCLRSILQCVKRERMKMRTPHIVPLARQALEVLGMLRELTGHSEWLFPGALNPKKFMSNNTILKALERMGYKGAMTGHGFRGLASTTLHEQGYNHAHIEVQLAHTQRNAVSAAYNHALYLEPRTKMMQDWADFLEQAQRGAKVLPFREA